MNWGSRSARITRLKEKGEFERMFMPLSYLGLAVGLVILLYQGVMGLEGEKTNEVGLAIGGFLFFLPLLLTFYRLLRGHFSKRLIA